MMVDKKLTAAEISENRVVVRFKALRLREQNEVELVSRELEEIAEEGPFAVMVLDFSDVRMLTSSFLGRLLMLRRKLKADDAELRACCMEKGVFEGFNVLKLQKLIPVFSTVNEALE